MYANKKCDYRIKDILNFKETSSGSETVALTKGTYYIQMYAHNDKPSIKIKVTVQKAVNQSNYCRAKAVTLKPNKTVRIAQTSNYCYDRWYRITLNRKKAVTITTNEYMAQYITLYDSRMQEVAYTSGSRKVISEDPIKKGTYFIRVISPGYYNVGEYVGSYMTLSWN